MWKVLSVQLRRLPGPHASVCPAPEANNGLHCRYDKTHGAGRTCQGKRTYPTLASRSVTGPGLEAISDVLHCGVAPAPNTASLGTKIVSDQAPLALGYRMWPLGAVVGRRWLLPLHTRHRAVTAPGSERRRDTHSDWVPSPLQLPWLPRRLPGAFTILRPFDLTSTLKTHFTNPRLAMPTDTRCHGVFRNGASDHVRTLDLTRVISAGTRGKKKSHHRHASTLFTPLRLPSPFQSEVPPGR